jgi:hypothetical protein
MNSPKKVANISIENAVIKFRNFSGKPGKYNAKGSRNFCVALEKEFADILKQDGWNVRASQPKDPDDDILYTLQVAVSFERIPPKVIYITSKSKRTMDEEDISMLDWVQIRSADVIINPSVWEVNEKSGIKAYLNALYITVEEDEFESKYEDVPDSAASSFKDYAEE